MIDGIIQGARSVWRAQKDVAVFVRHQGAGVGVMVGLVLLISETWRWTAGEAAAAGDVAAMSVPDLLREMAIIGLWLAASGPLGFGLMRYYNKGLALPLFPPILMFSAEGRQFARWTSGFGLKSLGFITLSALVCSGVAGLIFGPSPVVGGAGGMAGTIPVLLWFTRLSILAAAAADGVPWSKAGARQATQGKPWEAALVPFFAMIPGLVLLSVVGQGEAWGFLPFFRLLEGACLELSLLASTAATWRIYERLRRFDHPTNFCNAPESHGNFRAYPSAHSPDPDQSRRDPPVS